MKRSLFLSIILFLSYTLTSQDFIAPLYISDTNSINVDTVWVGYSPESTFDIDTQFGESDIFSIPLDSFDIRLGRINLPSSLSIFVLSFDEATINQSKIDIVPKFCQEYIDGYRNSYSALFIPNDLLPLDISWDSTLYHNECVNASIITDWRPDTWWDVVPPNVTFGSIHLRTNSNLRINAPTGLQVITNNHDTLSLLFVFLDSSFVNDLEETKDNKIKIKLSPNPASSYIYVEQKEAIDDLFFKLYALDGRLVLQKRIIEDISEIDVSKIPKGVFFYQIYHSKTGRFSNGKLIKQ